MKNRVTQRGFKISEFNDDYGLKCSLQKSSSFNNSIWLGIDNPKLCIFENENRGKYIETDMPKTFSVNSRMHLTREIVSDLLPYLVRFVETGEI